MSPNVKPDPLGMFAEQIDDQVCEASSEPTRGVFLDVLITLLPGLLQLFQNCPKKPKPAPPVDPVPTPTPAQTRAWETAWDAKCRAKDAFDPDSHDYDSHSLRMAAKEARKQKRKNGEHITQQQAIELGRASLDAARTGEMTDLRGAILQINDNRLNAVRENAE